MRLVDATTRYTHPYPLQLKSLWKGPGLQTCGLKAHLSCLCIETMHCAAAAAHGVFTSQIIEDCLWPLGITGGTFALRAHCALLLDYVPPEEPPSTPLGNALRIR